MSTDVWQITARVTADEYINKMAMCNIFGDKNVNKAKAAAQICDELRSTYSEITDEQYEFLFEIEAYLKEIMDLETELEAETEEREEEIAQKNTTLEDKNLTDEELEENETEVESLYDEINNLNSDYGEQISDKSSEVLKSKDKSQNARSKVQTAQIYANKAIEIGEPLSETKDKTKTVVRKIFGGWDESETREAGERAVTAGNNLLNYVSESNNIQSEIDKKSELS